MRPPPVCLCLWGLLCLPWSVGLDEQPAGDPWRTQHQLLTNVEWFQSPERSCTFPELKQYIPYNVFYINLDSAKTRRQSMERHFGCLNLTRIPAVNGRDRNLAQTYLAHALKDVPGLVDEFDGESAVDEEKPRPQTKRGEKMFLGALGCHLSHIKAAYTMLALQLPAALILEDDMTPELVPYWTKPNLFWTLDTNLFSAVQLSIQSSPAAWERIKAARARGQTLVQGSTGPNSVGWFASNGAYLLTRKGAAAIIRTLVDPSTLKVNLTQLMCINIDICLMPFLTEKAIAVPPLFVHALPAESVGSSIVPRHARDKYHLAVGASMSFSRESAIDLAMDTYIRNPDKRLKYYLAEKE